MRLSDPRQIGAVALALLTSGLHFFRYLLLLNRLSKWRELNALYALSVSLVSGLLLWASLNSLASPYVQQFAISGLGAVLRWLGITLAINGIFRFPTRQQWAALSCQASTELLLVAQVRLVYEAVH